MAQRNKLSPKKPVRDNEVCQGKLAALIFPLACRVVKPEGLEPEGLEHHQPATTAVPEADKGSSALV